eukprot:TRINITY_DN1810_c0_g4_i2.p2 TRINITY_DN1810_c0_g4~~TRINITY_DN1810_c0_g4_i2.p2  ORF type:complete len:148 (-),score=34.16 TRINITY_DN1810_c0_g4_i2:150-593(-)
MDKIGLMRFLLMLIFSIAVFTVSANTTLYATQILCLVFSTFIGVTWQTFASRWMVHYISPTLLGSGGGVISFIVGITQVGLNIGTPYLMQYLFTGMITFTMPLYIFGGLSVACGITLVLWIYWYGITPLPPPAKEVHCECCCPRHLM